MPPGQTVSSLAGQKHSQARVENRTGTAGIVSAPAPVASGYAAIVRPRPCLDCGQARIDKEYV